MRHSLFLIKNVLKVTLLYSENSFSGVHRMNTNWNNLVIEWYKGSDGYAEFFLYDIDRRPVKLLGKDAYFVVYSPSGEIEIESKCKTINDQKGRLSVTVPEFVIDRLREGEYRFSIKIADSDSGFSDFARTDINGRAFGVLRIRGETMPKPQVQKIVEFMPVSYGTETHYIGQSFLGIKNKKSNIITVAVYFENFTGKLWIETSLTPNPDQVLHNWVAYPLKVDTEYVEYTQFSGIDAFNIEGNFAWVRIRYKPETKPGIDDPGRITKTLVV